jgi:hypothetical protein
MEYFMIHYFPYIILGLVVGVMHGIQNSKIQELIREIKLLKECDIHYLKDDIDKYKHDKWDLIKREELISSLFYLRERITILETKLYEITKE